jgi:hypothetical protein
LKPKYLKNTIFSKSKILPNNSIYKGHQHM